jgi:hypothetical protein
MRKQLPQVSFPTLFVMRTMYIMGHITVHRWISHIISTLTISTLNNVP